MTAIWKNGSEVPRAFTPFPTDWGQNAFWDRLRNYTENNYLGNWTRYQ